MTAFVTLQDLKANAAIDHNDEDVMLTGFLKVAVALVSGVGSLTGVDVTALPLDDPKRDYAKDAALLHATHRYQNRESVVIGTISSELPYGFEMLVNMIRVERY